MIAPNHDRSLDRTFLHQVVDGEAKPRSLAISQPADARWESLELDALAGEFNPAAQAAILGKQFQNKSVGHGDVRRLARKRRPAERPAPFAKQRTNIFRNESRKIVSVLHAALKRERPN